MEPVALLRTAPQESVAGMAPTRNMAWESAEVLVGTRSLRITSRWLLSASSISTSLEINLVTQRRYGARLVHLAVEVIIEGCSCHLRRLGVMLLTSLAVAAFNDVEIPPSGFL